MRKAMMVVTAAVCLTGGLTGCVREPREHRELRSAAGLGAGDRTGYGMFSVGHAPGPRARPTVTATAE